MAVVIVSLEAQKQIDKLPAGIVPRIYKLVERLGKWPQVSGAKPLRGNLAGHFRLRTGDFRMIYKVASETVHILYVGNRKDIYPE